MNRLIEFEELGSSDLIVDALYKGGEYGNLKSEVISKILGCSVSGGFRYIGNVKNFNLSYVMLYSNLNDPDWPDYLDEQTGRFIYFGDNRNPGSLLHETNKKGNIILKKSFDKLHKEERKNIPPFFIFTKSNRSKNSWDRIFRGLAVPGAEGLKSTDDLVAVWKSKEGERFQNYKAVFTILDINCVCREWIEDLCQGEIYTENAPKEWLKWVQGGEYSPLKAERSIEHRSKEEQLPDNKEGKEMIRAIYEYFNNPYEFEKCAAKLVRLMDENIISCDLTKPHRDGGRDALGKYRVGLSENSIEVEFALEAKRNKLNSGSGVRQTSRLISRLRHRQFGFFVTTSFVSNQAYKEIKDDGHPVIIICARDIVKILKQSGISTANKLKDWLIVNF